MIKWLKLFCSPLRKIVTPTAFDMTYKCGPYLVKDEETCLDVGKSNMSLFCSLTEE